MDEVSCDRCGGEGEGGGGMSMDDASTNISGLGR